MDNIRRARLVKLAIDWFGNTGAGTPSPSTPAFNALPADQRPRANIAPAATPVAQPIASALRPRGPSATDQALAARNNAPTPTRTVDAGTTEFNLPRPVLTRAQRHVAADPTIANLRPSPGEAAQVVRAGAVGAALPTQRIRARDTAGIDNALIGMRVAQESGAQADFNQYRQMAAKAGATGLRSWGSYARPTAPQNVAAADPHARDLKLGPHDAAQAQAAGAFRSAPAPQAAPTAPLPTSIGMSARSIPVRPVQAMQAPPPMLSSPRRASVLAGAVGSAPTQPMAPAY